VGGLLVGGLVVRDEEQVGEPVAVDVVGRVAA
jgi:hypothetical protein